MPQTGDKNTRNLNPVEYRLILEEIFKKCDEAIVVSDDSGHLLFHNPTFDSFLPLSSNLEDMPSILKEINPEALNSWNELQKLASGDIPSSQFINLNNNKVLSVSLKRITLNNHEKLWLSTWQDITHEVLLQHDLKQATTMLDLTQSVAGIGCWQTDLKKDKMIWSDELFNLAGIAATTEINIKTCLKKLAPDSRRCLLKKLRDTIKNCTPFEEDLKFFTPDGSEKWGRASCRTIKNNGKCASLYGTFQDITEIKTREHTLLRSYELLSTILGSIDASIYVCDFETHEILFSNKLGGKDFLTTTKGKKCWEVIYNQDHQCYNCPESELLDEKGNPSGLFIREFTDPRTQKTYLCHDRAVSWISGKMAHLQVALDITGRKKLEEEITMAMAQSEAANRSKGEFLANMSHEIRTPLNGIFGMLELVRTTELSAEQKEYINTAIESGKSLLTVINDILDFSKMEAGKMDIVEFEFDLEQCIKSVLKSFSVQVRDKNLNLSTKIAHGTPRCLIGDESRIRQILFNIIGNAVKFTFEGSIEVEISYEPTPLSPKEYRFIFEVKDTGIGIAADKQDIIFQSFTQADGSYTRKFSGTGLGLAIVKRLTTLLGGDVSVQSTEHKGSTFTFSVVSKVQQDHFPCGHQKKENTREAPTLPPLAILLVEDERINRLSASRILEKCGHDVTSAENGFEALKILEKSTFDCILMDIQMPIMDGVEAAKKIKESPKYINSRDTPIIAMTAHTMRGDKEKFLESGMDAYVPKPIEFKKLTEVIARLLDI